MTYLGEVLLAIHEDKLPLMGTFAWGNALTLPLSLMLTLYSYGR